MCINFKARTTKRGDIHLQGASGDFLFLMRIIKYCFHFSVVDQIESLEEKDGKESDLRKYEDDEEEDEDEDEDEDFDASKYDLSASDDVSI